MIHELIGHADLNTTMSHTLFLNQGPMGIRSHADIPRQQTQVLSGFCVPL